MLDIVNLESLEARARDQLDPMLFDYIAGGAGDEWTLRENRAAWSRIQLLPRMLRGVGSRRLDTTVLGTPVPFPVLVPPMGFHGLCHPDAELATARGTAAAGTIFVASTVSNRSLEATADACDGPRWFQLYVYRDREITRDLVRRAAASGYRAICLTVDTPLAGPRERDRRNRLRMPEHLGLDNFPSSHAESHKQSTGSAESALARYIARELDPDLSWKDVAWLRDLSGLPVIVKGILAPDDASRAVDEGAEAIIVSNHGGRQLDGVPASITILPRVVAAVSGRAEVLLDGGVRRGTDVLKALALGARAVLVGRPVLWGLTLDGAEGVRAVLDHVRAELDLAMALAGCRTIADIAPDLIAT
jgi:4-hydroxymandelate oxidase